MEVAELAQILGRAQAITLAPIPVRTRLGDKISRSLNAGDYRPLGRALIQSGLFHDQARQLVEASELAGDGTMSCPQRTVVAVAPQLGGVIRWWPGADTRSTLLIPRELVLELTSAWASWPSADAPWLTTRKAVGERAERYTIQRETEALGDPTLLRWVSRESDALGWDIEDHSVEPFRAIEVKGSRNRDMLFFVSDNELAGAQELGARYEVHYWGAIDLETDAASEFSRLQNAGYPVVIKDFAAALARGEWSAEPTKWRITPSSENAEQPAPAPMGESISGDTVA